MDVNGSYIKVDDTKQYQHMVGFGAALTDSSAWVLWNLPDDQRKSALNSLFDPEVGIGITYIRLPISACDFSLTNWTYDNQPDGDVDPDLLDFSIAHDLNYTIPVLKEILKINPSLKILVTPWSPPGWMKNTDILLGTYENVTSVLLDQYYNSLALYFVKTIQGYHDNGIHIDSMTIQNEPLYGPDTYPGMEMSPKNQTYFINNFLVPNLINASIDVKVYVYDHNWNAIDYPLYVLENLDETAYDYIYGVALHCYLGNVSNQSFVHDQYPDKPMLLTECSGGAWSPNFTASLVWDQLNIMSTAANYWSTGTMKWNLVLNQDNGPQNNGCADCYGLLTINTTNNNKVTYMADFYSVGTMSKYIRPDARRIDTLTNDGNLIVAGFLNVDTSRVLVVTNQGSETDTFTINWQKQQVQTTLQPGTVAVYKWFPQ